MICTIGRKKEGFYWSSGKHPHLQIRHFHEIFCQGSTEKKSILVYLTHLAVPQIKKLYWKLCRLGAICSPLWMEYWLTS
jgi:hypothetical protein